MRDTQKTRAREDKATRTRTHNGEGNGGVDASLCKLFFCDVPLAATAQQVLSVVATHGCVDSVTLHGDAATPGLSRGCGVVLMASHGDAIQAVCALSSVFRWNGMRRPMKLTWARKQEEAPSVGRTPPTSVCPSPRFLRKEAASVPASPWCAEPGSPAAAADGAPFAGAWSATAAAAGVSSVHLLLRGLSCRDPVGARSLARRAESAEVGASHVCECRFNRFDM
jgi:hypothetical protein